MIVTCPQCSTKYNLPDASARPGAKARCTVCKLVFTLEQGTGEEQALHSKASAPRDESTLPDVSDIVAGVQGYNLDDMAPPAKPDGGKRSVLVIALVVLVLALGGFAVWKFMQIHKADKAAAEAARQARATEQIKDIALRSVRQYYINNEKVGQVSVIEGRIVNNFTTPKELVKVEASLYDKDGNTVVSKQQLCGTTVSLFHMQVLSEQELETALNNKIDILTNNTNIAPGGEVPFLVVFYNPPSTVTEFGVKVVEARNPPEKKQ